MPASSHAVLSCRKYAGRARRITPVVAYAHSRGAPIKWAAISQADLFIRGGLRHPPPKLWNPPGDITKGGKDLSPPFFHPPLQPTTTSRGAAQSN